MCMFPLNMNLNGFVFSTGRRLLTLQIINMGWLSKIFKGSVNRVSRGHYNGNSHEGYSTQHTKSYVQLCFHLILLIFMFTDANQLVLSNTYCKKGEEENHINPNVLLDFIYHQLLNIFDQLEPPYFLIYIRTHNIGHVPQS